MQTHTHTSIGTFTPLPTPFPQPLADAVCSSIHELLLSASLLPKLIQSWVTYLTYLFLQQVRKRSKKLMLVWSVYRPYPESRPACTAYARTVQVSYVICCSINVHAGWGHFSSYTVCHYMDMASIHVSLHSSSLQCSHHFELQEQS